MRWKRGGVAVCATVIITFLIFATAVLIGPATDRTELAKSPAGSGATSEATSAGAPETPPPIEASPTEKAQDPKRPRKPRTPPASIDPDAVAALKAALRRAGQKPEAPTLSTLEPVAPSTLDPGTLDLAAPTTLDFVLSSFNVLGSSHSRAGGTRSQMAPGQTRIRWASGLLARHGVDVVGFQEFQLDQARAFIAINRGRYDVYPGARLGGAGSQNSIAWRTDTWEVVDADTIAIPYFNGHTLPMPVVLLRNRETGLAAYFTNFHNPASTPRHPNQARWRGRALAREIALVNQLIARTDLPVFLTGDLNEREDAFCAVTGRSAMSASSGGSHAGSCRPPREIGIDWIFGSPDVTFSNHRTDRSRLVNRTSDHPMVLSDVRIEGDSQGH